MIDILWWQQNVENFNRLFRSSQVCFSFHQIYKVFGFCSSDNFDAPGAEKNSFSLELYKTIPSYSL